MKIVFIETPSTKDRDVSVEMSQIPEGWTTGQAVFDEYAENNDQFYAEIATADAICMYGYVYFDKEKIDAMPKCKVFSFQSTGFNEIDFDYATEKGIAITSILDYCTQETAENAMAMMLCLQRDTLKYNTDVHVKKVWEVDMTSRLKRIDGQTMGIIGLGRIGQNVAKKAQGFDMTVIAYDPFLPPHIAEEKNVKLVDLDTIYAESDVISVHMNLTPENHHMLCKESFMKMKKKPIIINEGRGPMICEEDLAWALDEGLVRGAGLDMLESEVPDREYLENCPLVGRHNVILNPHSGYFSDMSEYLVGKLAVENTVLCLQGRFSEASVVRNGITALRGE